MNEPRILKPQQSAAEPQKETQRLKQHLRYELKTHDTPAGIEEDEISLLEIWQVLVEYKWLIALLIGIFGAASTTYALLATPVYRAELLMVSVSKDGQKGGLAALAGQFGGLASMVGVDIGGGGDPAVAIATLKSRQFTRQFIQDEKLLPILFAKEQNAKTGQWLSSNPEKIPGMWDAFKLFDNIRTVSENRKSGFITLAIEWEDPVLAAKWATQLVDRVNQQLRENAVADVKKNLDYLRKQLETTDVVAVQQSLSSLIEAEIKKSMLANVNEEYAFRVVDPAVVPEEKVRPKRALIVIVGLFLGGMIGVFAAFVLNFIKRVKAG